MSFLTPNNLKYGGYKGSDSSETMNRETEPTINWNVESGMDYVTTFSQLQKEGYSFIYNTLTTKKPDNKTEKGYKPLTFFNLWNFDCIVSWGDNDGNSRLAKNWFYTMMEQEKLQDALLTADQEKIALQLRIIKLEEDVKANSDEQLLFEIQRNRKLKKEIEEVRGERDRALGELKSQSLRMDCIKGERDEYKYQLKKSEKENKRLHMLLDEAERNYSSAE